MTSSHLAILQFSEEINLPKRGMLISNNDGDMIGISVQNSIEYLVCVNVRAGGARARV